MIMNQIIEVFKGIIRDIKRKTESEMPNLKDTARNCP